MQNQAKKYQLVIEISALSEIYERKIMGDIAFNMYWEDLENYDINDIRKAIALHRRDPEKGSFMPKPSDILRHLQIIVDGGDVKTRANEAWKKVWKAVNYPGGTTSVVFDDPMIHVVIDEMGGWVTLCSTEIKDAPWKAREFVDCYVNHRARGTENYKNLLPGSKKLLENLEWIDKIYFVGDEEKAKKVYAGRCEMKKIEESTEHDTVPGKNLEKHLSGENLE